MGLKKADALLLSDPNLLIGVFDAVLCQLYNAGARLKIAVALRIASQCVGVGLLIYCHAFKGTGVDRAAESAAVIFLLAAAGLFIVTRCRLKELIESDTNNRISSGRWVLIVYVAMYIMPVAAFLNLGVALALKPALAPLKTAVWAAQLLIKATFTFVLVVYSHYYLLYAEAWHCYKHEARLSDYKYGYCPSYTHDGNYLDPGNSVCRRESMTEDCYGDRTTYTIPRRWLSHGRWTYALLVVVIHITLAQAVAGINGVRGLF